MRATRRCPNLLTLLARTNERTAQAPPLQVGQSLVFVGAMLASSHAPRAASRNQNTKPIILAPFKSESDFIAQNGVFAVPAGGKRGKWDLSIRRRQGGHTRLD